MTNTFAWLKIAGRNCITPTITFFIRPFCLPTHSSKRLCQTNNCTSIKSCCQAEGCMKHHVLPLSPWLTCKFHLKHLENLINKKPKVFSKRY